MLQRRAETRRRRRVKKVANGNFSLLGNSPQRANKDSNISGGYLPIILPTLQRPSRSRNNKNQKRKSKTSKREQNGKRAECLVFSKYYASAQSCARTPEERSLVTWRTASSSPERSRHRCTRSSPKFSLRWLAA